MFNKDHFLRKSKRKNRRVERVGGVGRRKRGRGGLNKIVERLAGSPLSLMSIPTRIGKLKSFWWKIDPFSTINWIWIDTILLYTFK